MSTLHCLFCGGKDCKYEKHELWPDNALEGLYSNWITDSILAMQRPSSRLISSFQLVDKFKANNIRSIFNLQQPGEHASCGDGLEISGFSYSPEAIMDAGIFYYNFSWPDMDIPSMELMTNLVQVMDNALQDEKKIAVHCHAGLGRTGLSIACYLVFANGLDPQQAISTVRQKRPLSLQTTKQTEFVKRFQQHLEKLKTMFPGIVSAQQQSRISVQSVPFEEILERQRQLSHGKDLRANRYIPKIVSHVLCCLDEQFKDTDPNRVYEHFLQFEGLASLNPTMIQKQDAINHGDWTCLDSQTDTKILVEIMLYWMLSIKTPIIENQFLEKLSLKAQEESTTLPAFSKEAYFTIKAILSGLQLQSTELTAVNETKRLVVKKLAVIVTAFRSSIRYPYPHWIKKPLPEQVKDAFKRSINDLGSNMSGAAQFLSRNRFNTSKASEARDDDLIPFEEEVPSPQLLMVAERFLFFLANEQMTWDSFEARQEKESPIENETFTAVAAKQLQMTTTKIGDSTSKAIETSKKTMEYALKSVVQLKSNLPTLPSSTFWGPNDADVTASQRIALSARK